MSEQVLHKGSCHCGAIQLTILAPRDIDICECNCSICSMKGLDTPTLSIQLHLPIISTYHPSLPQRREATAVK